MIYPEANSDNVRVNDYYVGSTPRDVAIVKEVSADSFQFGYRRKGVNSTVRFDTPNEKGLFIRNNKVIAVTKGLLKFVKEDSISQQQ